MSSLVTVPLSEGQRAYLGALTQQRDQLNEKISLVTSAILLQQFTAQQIQGCSTQFTMDGIEFQPNDAPKASLELSP